MSKPIRAVSRRLRLPLHERHALRRLATLRSQPRTLDELVDASLDLGTRGLLKVKAQQKRSEILRLAHTVRELKPRVVLEIGTARGGTLLIWSELASQRVVTCDLEQPRYRRRVYRAFPPRDSGVRIVPLAGDSHDPGFRKRVEAELAGAEVDFLFIDGDHTAAGVTADYEDYRHLVRPGGVIAFHDILENQPFATNQVYQLWKRLREEQDVEEYVDDSAQCGFGVGVLRVPA